MDLLSSHLSWYDICDSDAESSSERHSDDSDAWVSESGEDSESEDDVDIPYDQLVDIGASDVYPREY